MPTDTQRENSKDAQGMAAIGVTHDRRKRSIPVANDRRRKAVVMPAWAGTSSRLATRSDEARQRRRRGDS